MKQICIVLVICILAAGCAADGKTEDKVADKLPHVNQTIPMPVLQANQTTDDPACTDSDEGQDLFVRGTTASYSQVQYDTCDDGISVDEYYCENGVLKQRTRICPAGYQCSEGRCVGADTIPQDCTDSDGQEIRKKGQVVRGSDTYEDACTGIQNVKEYYCRNNEIKNTILRCPSGTKCHEGACIQYEPRCEDTDNGINATAYGEVTIDTGTGILDLFKDSCIDQGTLEEAYCMDGRVAKMTIACRQGGRCSSGACEEVAECRENDFGFDTRHKGTTRIVTYIGGGSTSREYTDECNGSGILREYYCFENEVATQNVVCSCNGGECIQ